MAKLKLPLLIFLILIGIFFRVYKINSVPEGIFSDEIALGINAKTIAQNGVDEFGNSYPFGFESFSDFKLPGYIYFTAVFFKIFGPQIITIRLAAILSSIFTIPLIGYLTFLLFPKKQLLPFYAMVILALSPFHIHFGRIAYETMLATFFMTGYLVLLIKTIQTKKLIWLIPGIIALIISSWTYPAPRFIIPVFTFTLLVYFLVFNKVKEKKLSIYLFIFLIISILTYLPTLINPAIDKRTMGYVLSSEGNNIIIQLYNKLFSTFSSWLRIWDMEFLFIKGDLFALRHGTSENGLFLGIFIIPLVFGIIYFIKSFSTKNLANIIILLLLIICGLPSALTSSTPYGPRLLPMVIPLTIVIALGIDTIISYVKIKNNYFLKGTILGSIFILFFQILSFSHIYFVHFMEKSFSEFPNAPIQLTEFLKEQIIKSPEKTIYYLNGKSCWPWGHDELKLWYFADLNNSEMIKWNNLFRKERYDSGDPFANFDTLDSPRFQIDNIILNASHEEMSKSSEGSLLVRCGVHINNINQNNEKIINIFNNGLSQKDPIYFVTETLSTSH